MKLQVGRVIQLEKDIKVVEEFVKEHATEENDMFSTVRTSMNLIKEFSGMLQGLSINLGEG